MSKTTDSKIISSAGILEANFSLVYSKRAGIVSATIGINPRVCVVGSTPKFDFTGITVPQHLIPSQSVYGIARTDGGDVTLSFYINANGQVFMEFDGNKTRVGIGLGATVTYCS